MEATELAGRRDAAAPPTESDRRLAGALLVAASALAAIGAVWLSVAFGWPEILDEPGSVALPRFADHAGAVRAAFFTLLISSALLIPAAVTLDRVLGPTVGGRISATRAVTVAGVVGAFSQVLGWVRWPVTVPHLADARAAAASDAERVAVDASYDVLNRYAGGALGEHLGWLFQGAWAVGLAALLVGAVGVPRWFARTGLVLSVAWWPLLAAAGPVPEVEWLAPVGSTISVAWYVWLLALGVVLLVTPPERTAA